MHKSEQLLLRTRLVHNADGLRHLSERLETRFPGQQIDPELTQCAIAGSNAEAWLELRFRVPEGRSGFVYRDWRLSVQFLRTPEELGEDVDLRIRLVEHESSVGRPYSDSDLAAALTRLRPVLRALLADLIVSDDAIA